MSGELVAGRDLHSVQGNPPGLLALPSEIAMKIFPYFGKRDLNTCRCICIQIRDVVDANGRRLYKMKGSVTMYPQKNCMGIQIIHISVSKVTSRSTPIMSNSIDLTFEDDECAFCSLSSEYVYHTPKFAFLHLCRIFCELSVEFSGTMNELCAELILSILKYTKSLRFATNIKSLFAMETLYERLFDGKFKIDWKPNDLEFEDHFYKVPGNGQLHTKVSEITDEQILNMLSRTKLEKIVFENMLSHVTSRTCGKIAVGMFKQASGDRMLSVILLRANWDVKTIANPNKIKVLRGFMHLNAVRYRKGEHTVSIVWRELDADRVAVLLHSCCGEIDRSEWEETITKLQYIADYAVRANERKRLRHECEEKRKAMKRKAVEAVQELESYFTD